MKGWFGGLPSIGNQTRQEIDEEILEAAMAGVFDLRDILELINDALDQGAFAQEKPIYQRQQARLHIALECRDQLDTALQELLEQSLGDVAFITKELAKQPLGEFGNRLAIITIAGREDKGA